MNDKMLEINTDITEEYKAAVELHCKVMMAHEQVGNALLEFAKQLKAMRDGKQYTLLGFSDFDEYIEKGISIGKRQVYNYISTYETLGSDILQSNAQLGITKLALIAEVSDIKRADFIEDNDLEGMSVKEIKALIEQSKSQIEQINMLTEAAQSQKARLEQVNLENEEADEANTDMSLIIDQLKTELADLKAKPIDVAVAELSNTDIEKIKADAANTAKKAIKSEYEKSRKSEIKLAEEKAIEKAKKDFDKQLEAVRSQAALEAADRYKSSLSEIEAQKAIAIEKAEKLAKELKVAVDGDMTTIQFYLDELSSLFTKITTKINEIEIKDEEKAKGLNKAIGKILSVLIEQVK